MIEINGKHMCESCFCETTEGAFCMNCGYNPNQTAVDPTMLKPGSVLLGKYVVGRVIGKGGFGVTYVAYDVTTQKKVAIKEYFPYGVALRAPGTTTVSVSSMDNAEAFRMGAEKFYNEAKMVSRFNGNPNIVGVHEFFYENDTVYFAMEYLQGHTLKEHIKIHGVLPSAQALFIMNNVSNALMAAHSANVLHRDISPDNIILCDNGNVTLIDFGAARQVVAEHSQSFSVILKPGFAPLEQYQKKGNQGPWTDIYSLGTTIYHALTGDIPEDPMSRIDDDEEFSSNAYGIEPELWAVIQKATQLRAEDRYGDVFMLRNDLSRISYKPEPVIVPTESEDEKMPQFQTAVPYGMTQVQPVAAPQSAAAVQPVPAAAVQPVPAEKKKFDFGEFCKKNTKAVIGAAAALVLVIAAAILIPNMLKTDEKPPYKNSGYSDKVDREDDDTSSSSSQKELVNKNNTLAKYLTNQVNVDITRLDAEGYSFPQGVIAVAMTVDNNGEWFVTAADEELNTIPRFEDELYLSVRDLFSDVKDRAMMVMIYNRKVTFAAVQQGTDVNYLAEFLKPLFDDYGNLSQNHEWNGKTAGVTKDGIIIGTYPVIGLK